MERCDARTQLEAQAYVAWIHGSLQFELELWVKATENLKKAQVCTYLLEELKILMVGGRWQSIVTIIVLLIEKFSVKNRYPRQVPPMLPQIMAVLVYVFFHTFNI